MKVPLHNMNSKLISLSDINNYLLSVFWFLSKFHAAINVLNFKFVRKAVCMKNRKNYHYITCTHIYMQLKRLKNNS